MQAIANTASFHFGYIEQGGASLYSSMALKVRDLEVLRIVIKHRRASRSTTSLFGTTSSGKQVAQLWRA